MKKALKAAVGLMLVALAPNVMASDTATYDKIVAMKAWDTWVDVVLETERHSCSTSGKDHFKISTADTEMIRLAEAAWLSGKKVALSYTCAAIGNGTNAKVTGVRAQ